MCAGEAIELRSMAYNPDIAVLAKGVFDEGCSGCDEVTLRQDGPTAATTRLVLLILRRKLRSDLLIGVRNVIQSN